MFGISAAWIIVDYKTVLKDAVIVVEGKFVKDIGAQERIKKDYPDLKIEERRDDIVLPAFINGHTHNYGILSWGIPKLNNFVDFEGFLKKYWWPFIEDRITEKEAIATMEESCFTLLETGISCFCDTLEAPKIESGILIKLGKIVETFGLNAVLSIESSERVDIKNGMDCINENISFIKSVSSKQKLKGSICTHTTFTCSSEFIKQAKKMSDELQTSLQFHLCESKYESEFIQKKYGMSAPEYLDSLNVFSSNVIASQCVKVDETDLKILKKHKVNIVHNPLSNCEVGGGIAPIPTMIDMGIEPALGTDGYVTDFFEVMRTAFLIHKASSENTEVMPAEEVFKMATQNGANVLGFKDKGTLHKDCFADFIIMNDRFTTPITMDNIFEQIVVKGEKQYIDEFYIDGEKKVENGSVLRPGRNQSRKIVKEISKDFWRFAEDE